jgi:hypothetical protein
VVPFYQISPSKFSMQLFCPPRVIHIPPVYSWFGQILGLQWQIIGKAEDLGFVGCDAVSLGERFVTFERTYCLRSQASDALDLKNDGCTLLRDVGNISPSDTPSHRRRPENTCFPGSLIVLSYTRLPIACSAHHGTQYILYHFTLTLRHARKRVVG